MFRGLMQESPLLISSLIEYAARYHGNTEIVSRLPDGSIFRYGYRTLCERAKKLAAALVAAGVKPGDRIATLAWNTHRHMELYYAVSGIGAILHTVNPRLFPDQLDYIFNHAEDRLLFFDLTFAKLVNELRPRLKTVTGLIALGAEGEVAPLRKEEGLSDVRAYEDFIAAHAPDYVWPELDENTASSLCYTSGTTGNPKGVLYSHRSTVLHAFAVCMADGLALSSRHSVLLIVPLFHANGWGVPYAGPMTGAKLVLPGPMLDGESVCQLINSERCNMSMGVPTVWTNFLAFLDKHPEKRPTTLKRVLIGGSAAPPAMIERLEKDLGIDVQHLWGMTETSPLGTSGSPPYRLSLLSDDERRALKLKQGRAMYGVDMKIVGDDGYFATGDVATLDDEGFMQITDRAKDVIKSGGEWISSIELENAAMAHPAVQQAAVIGVFHPLWQERPLLLIVRKPEAEVRPDELREFLTQKVAKWWLPDAIEFIKELPYTATGKISKLTLRKRFADYKLPASEVK